MSKPRPAACGHSRPRSDAGFALLITVTLLAFLVLLLVSLASLTRVETQVAANNQQLEQARQNALMALNIAVGQLQKLAGPDQRTTAPAEVLGADASGAATGLPARPTALTSDANYETALTTWEGNLASYWSTRSRHWTGVWANPDAPEDIYTQTPVPVFLGWLVSGAATPAYTVSTGTSAGITQFGKVTVTAAAASGPLASDTISGVTATSDAIAPGITVGASDGVLLASRKTLGSTATAGDFVVAPLVAIKVASGSIPGLAAGGADVTVGRYAFWVGDEGVKAKVNLVDRHDAVGASDDEYRYRLLAAQRNAGELLTGFAGLKTEPNAAKLTDVLDTGQLALAGAGIDRDQEALRFHDATFSSRGVLADAQRGGLRRDLTADLESGSLTGRFLPAAVAPPNGPTWEALRSFYDLGKASGPVGIRAGSATVMAITPVLMRHQVAFGFRVGESGAHTVRIGVAFMVANPCSAPIQAASLDFHAAKMSASDTAQRSFYLKIGTDYVWRKDFVRFLDRFTFRTGAVSLAAGEAKVFTMTADVTVATANSASASEIIPLSEGFNPATALVMDAPQAATNTATTYEFFYDTNQEANPATATSGAYYNHVDLLAGGTTSRLQRWERLGFVNPAAGTKRTGTLPAAGVTVDGWVFDRSFKTPADMGAASAVRSYADYNLRAPVTEQTILHKFANRGFNANPLVGATASGVAADYGEDLEEPHWGNSFADASGGGKKTVVLHDIPRGGTAVKPVILSLGQLSHADLTAGVNTPSSIQPAWPLGNSWASPFVRRSQSKTNATWPTQGGGAETYYDISYQLNAFFWDSRYFSTIPPSGALVPAADTLLPNGRLRFATGTPPSATEARDPLTAAAGLLIDGGFNVNSTRVEAWRAVLSSLRELSVNGESSLSGPFPRSLHQPLGSAGAAVGDSDAAWAGFRNLSEDDIDTLARNIVRQVRLRGPFLSLAHFVNRRLIASPYVPEPSGSGGENDPETLDTEQGLRGALQAAIDASQLNKNINAAFPEVGVAASMSKLKNGYQDWRASTGAAAMGIPGWLSQADLLQPLGPVIASRSDTFRIRAYGEVRNPVTLAQEGRAWCEAVVQRFPDYVDTTISSSVDPSTLAGSKADSASGFGRRFRVVSFRWLGPDDI